MVRIPPEKHQDSIVEIAEDSFRTGEPQRNDLVQAEPNRFEALSSFGSDRPNVDRVITLFPGHQDLIPRHALEVGQLLSDVKQRRNVHPVPAIGIDQLHTGNPPGGVEMMVAMRRSGARDLPKGRLLRRNGGFLR